MSYKNLNIEKCYETTSQSTNLLDTFYIPFLSETTKYFRIAGFFNSTSLAIAAKGIAGLIKNGGIMKLLISPEISNDDFEIIKSFSDNSLNADSPLFSNFNINDFSSDEHLQALAWMLANNKLEIKIVIGKNNGTSLFHQKIGIGTDREGNMISFSGSINETASAWLNNIEEFKTFKSWEREQIDYLLSDLKKFNSYWNNEKKDVSRVFDLPDSIKKKIISVKPNDIFDLLIMKKYTAKKENNSLLSLFPHQSNGVATWMNNNYSLLFEMATGTGKTRTAIGCFTELRKTEKHILVIVATPQNTLSRQWKRDIESLKIKFDYSNIIDGSNSKWKSDLEMLLLNLNNGTIDDAIIYTTHDTVSSDKFISILKSNIGNLKILFICDECHAIGSEHQKQALLNQYKFRIGLSATPERMFDESGSTFIKQYFGGKSFEFTIYDALHTINPLTNKPFLNPFYYFPRFIKLDEEEQKKYNQFSKRIACAMSNDDVDYDLVNRLRTKRAEILKNAKAKLDEVEKIICEISNQKLKDTIIFSSDKQIDDVLLMLANKNITRSKITEHESSSKKLGIHGLTEREENIEQFRKGNIQCLVGIKCLDEGIDIKNARIAILMASSTNPREYVQRVGRVIRPSYGKKPSMIFDIIVETANANDSDDIILKKEARRALMIAKDAINASDVKKIFKEKGVDVNAY